MATTGRRGGRVRTASGGTTYRRAHKMHYRAASQDDRRRSFGSKAELAGDMRLAGLLGLVAYGLAEVVLLSAVAIVVGVASALLTFIGRQAFHMTGRGQRRAATRKRRGPLVRRSKRWAVRKVRLKIARRKQRRALAKKGIVQAQKLEQQVSRERAGYVQRKPDQVPAPVKKAAPRKRAAPRARPAAPRKDAPTKSTADLIEKLASKPLQNGKGGV